jgi:hypothetical protein
MFVQFTDERCLQVLFISPVLLLINEISAVKEKQGRIHFKRFVLFLLFV